MPRKRIAPKPQRKLVTDVQDSLPDYVTVDELIAWLQERRSEWTAAGYTEFKLQYDRPSRWDDYERLILYGYRPETEDEELARISDEAFQAKRRLELDREAYERLKKQFEEG